MKNVSKTLALILVVVMAFGLVACAGKTAPAAEAPAAEAPAAEAPAAEEPAAPVDDTVYKLNFAIAAADQRYFDGYPEFISGLTNGRVEIEFTDMTALGTAADCISLLRNGNIDLLFNSAGQTSSEFPVCDVLALPFVSQDPGMSVAILEALGEKGYLTEFENETHNMFYMASACHEMVLTKSKVEKLSDFPSHKVRATSGSAIKMLENFGATAVTIPFPDLYLSLSTDVVDGALSSYNMFLAFSIQDVTKFVLDVPFYSGDLFYMMSQKTWEELPADLQQIITDSNVEWQKHVLEETYKYDEECRQVFVDAGVEFYEPSEEFMNEMKAACADQYQAWADSLTALGYDGNDILATAQGVAASYKG